MDGFDCKPFHMGWNVLECMCSSNGVKGGFTPVGSVPMHTAQGPVLKRYPQLAAGAVKGVYI
jgi:hypothetical protein